MVDSRHAILLEMRGDVRVVARLQRPRVREVSRHDGGRRGRGDGPRLNRRRDEPLGGGRRLGYWVGGRGGRLERSDEVPELFGEREQRSRRLGAVVG
eukprot:2842125-Rhodomonas_salina.1